MITTRGTFEITPHLTNKEYLMLHQTRFKAYHPWMHDMQTIFRCESNLTFVLSYELHDLEDLCKLFKSNSKSVAGRVYFSVSWKDRQLIDFMYWDVVDNEVQESNPEYRDCNVMEVFCVNYEKDLNRLREENKLLKLHIKYMPEGKGAQKAKEHFKSLNN